jgi:hypothetical protein
MQANRMLFTSPDSLRLEVGFPHRYRLLRSPPPPSDYFRHSCPGPSQRANPTGSLVPLVCLSLGLGAIYTPKVLS